MLNCLDHWGRCKGSGINLNAFKLRSGRRRHLSLNTRLGKGLVYWSVFYDIFTTNLTGHAVRNRPPT